MIRRNLGKCPDCDEENIHGNRRCDCGYIFPNSARVTSRAGAAPVAMQGEQAAQKKRSLWPALIPALLVIGISTAMVQKQRSGFQDVEAAMGQETTKGATQGKSCVETYAVTMHTSEFYVRQTAPGVSGIRKKGAPRELSTVVRGTARNGCGEKLRSARVRVNVFDEKGKRGSAWAKIGLMAKGQAKPFELTWMGRVTKYEIAEIR